MAMRKIVIADAQTYGEDLDFSLFDPLGDVVLYGNSTPEQFRERVRDAEVLILNKLGCNETNCGHAEKLRLVCVAATGYDNIDLDFCRKRGIGVCNVPGYSAYSVSLVTVATALSLATHLPEYDAYTKSGRYTEDGLPNRLIPIYHEIAGKTWGVLGYGSIGKAVAQVARALGCRVLVCKRTPVEEEGISCVSFDTLCRESDILSLHVPLTAETRCLINRDNIGKMKDGVILVNEARGAITDEEAVAEAVLSGKIGGFGCDVYDGEPMRKDHPFHAITGKNVILTPHMAWGAQEARIRCMQEIAENIAAFDRAERRNRVD